MPLARRESAEVGFGKDITNVRVLHYRVKGATSVSTRFLAMPCWDIFCSECYRLHT